MNTDIGGGPLASGPYRPGFSARPSRLADRTTLAQFGHEPEFWLCCLDSSPTPCICLASRLLTAVMNRFYMTLFRQAPRALVEQSIGHWPEGLDRCYVYTLPAMALSPEEYRAIPQLLSDRPTAKFLQHQRSIDGPMIAGLSACHLPSANRRFSISSAGSNGWTGSCMDCDF